MKYIADQLLPRVAKVLNALPFVIVLAVSISGVTKPDLGHLCLSLFILIATGLNWILQFPKLRPTDMIGLRSVISFSIVGDLYLVFIGAVILHIATTRGYLYVGCWILATALISFSLAIKYWQSPKVPPPEIGGLPIRELRFDQNGKAIVEEVGAVDFLASDPSLQIEAPARVQSTKRRALPKDSGLVLTAGSLFAVISAMQINSHLPMDRDWAVLEACGAIIFVVSFLWIEIKRRYRQELILRMRVGAIVSCICGLFITPLLPVLLGYQYYRLYRALFASGDKATIAELKPVYVVAVIVILVASGILMFATLRLHSQGHV